MARYHRRRQADQKGTWRQALVFNSLLVILAVLASRVLVNAYSPQAFGGIADVEARDETRREIDRTFETIVPDGVPSRVFWADQIAEQLAMRDLSAARGYLLAAPTMLSRNDRRALMAAFAAEESGSEDDRLTRAGLLFLPNDVRANYQRAVERPNVQLPQTPPADEMSGATENEAYDDTGPPPTLETGTHAHLAGLPAGFSMIGDRADLVRRSQQWVNGDPVDTMQLRLGAIAHLGLQQEGGAPAYLSGISVLRAAGRAGRLDEAYLDYLRERVEAALPEETARQALRSSVSAVLPPRERQQQVLEAYREAVDAEGLSRLERDLGSISAIAAHTSPSGAVALVELARSPEDMRKLELVALSGSDRAVALAKEIGPRLTGLAQLGIRWSTGLVFQILGVVAIFIALGWSSFSALYRLHLNGHRW